MSYSSAAALQTAMFQRLSGFSALAGVSIVDALPPGTGTGTFVLLGPEVVTDRADRSGPGADHVVTISVISDASGFMAAKSVAAAVSDALVGAAFSLSVGRLVDLAFVRATARRLAEGDVRRIDLSFKARIEI